MINDKDKQEGQRRSMDVEREELQQATRYFIRSVFRTGVSLAFLPVNMHERFYHLMGIYYEFERTIYEEIDYVREAANAKRFKEMFKHDPMIYIPRVYDQYVSRRLLVLEWIDRVGEIGEELRTNHLEIKT